MLAPVIGRAQAPALQLMSMNVRRRLAPSLWPTRDRWATREPLLRALLAAESPSVLGVQEALPDQDDAVLAALGDGYERVGAGRNADGTDERCTVYWDGRRLELESWRQLALSAHPDRPGSRSWGSLFPRVAVVAGFRDRFDGRRFSVVNTHLDPFSGRSRSLSAAIVRSVVDDLGDAVAVMGDLNAGSGSSAVDALLAGGVLRDSWLEAEQRLTPAWRTYSGYRAPRLGSRIDWILAGRDVHVRAAAINAQRWNGRAASDHEAVQALVELRTDAPRTQDRGVGW